MRAPLMSLLKASVYAGTRPVGYDSRIRHVLDVNRELMGFVMFEVGIKRTTPRPRGRRCNPAGLRD